MSMSGYPRAIEMLPKCGGEHLADFASLDSQRFTELIEACVRGCKEQVEAGLATISHGQINSFIIELTPLVAVCCRESEDWDLALELVNRLLELGADPNFRDRQGRSPLVVAAWKSSPVVVARLLQAGATTEPSMEVGGPD
jgi:ankyrin repeat protein